MPLAVAHRLYTDNDSHAHSIGSRSSNSGGSHSHSGTVTGGSGPAAVSDVLPYLQLLVCVVPEPSTGTGLLAGIGLLLGIGKRRRR